MKIKIACLCVFNILLCVECVSKAKDFCLDPSGYTYVNKKTILIGRIAEGIQKIKGKHFYVCGNKLTDNLAENYATLLAYRIVTLGQYYKINPWGFAGTIYNESGFDHCALGKYPRIWAQKNGLIRKKRTTISYSHEEVVEILYNPYAKDYFNNTFDLGLCQILNRFYDGPPEHLLTINSGLTICAKEMRYRANHNSTSKPWMFWPGKKSIWYDQKIIHWARRMGATRKEI